MSHRARASALCAALLAAYGASAASPRVLVRGGNFLQAARVHPASGDILILTDPGDKSSTSNSSRVSVAVLPGGSAPGASFESLPVVDAGSAVTYPMDLVVSGDTAFVLDQDDGGVAAFNRTASGSWRLWRKWRFSQLLPDCDSEGRHFGLPESMALGPKGELYLSMAVMYNKRCLFHPLDRCCDKVSASTAVMRLDLSQGEDQASLHEVLPTKAFFTFSDGTDAGFHVRAMDTTAEGDLLLAGHGDGMGYFGHSVWRWDQRTQQTRRIAGQHCCQGNHSGDGGDATRATLDLPWGVAVVGGSVYISEAGNSDIRAVTGGVISVLESAPHRETFETDYFRRVTRGAKPGSLLLAISGLGSDDGRLLEVDLATGEGSTLMV